MKAKVKETGEIIEVLRTTNKNWMITYNSIDGCVYQPDDLLFQPEPFDIDWEQRRWEASMAAMQGMIVNGFNFDRHDLLCKKAISIAKELIKQYKE